MYLNYNRRKPRRWPLYLVVLLLLAGAVGFYVVRYRPELIPVERILAMPLPQPIQDRVQSQMAQVIPATPSPVPTVRVDHFARGEALFHEGQLVEAIRAYETAAQLDPDNPVIYARWARTLTLRRSYAKGIEKATRAVALNANSAEAQAALAFAFDWSGQYDKALAAARKAVDLAPNSPEAWGYLAEVQADKALWNESMESAEKAVQLGPKNYVALRNMGYAWEIRGQSRKAIEFYEQAALAEPRLSFIRLDIARNKRALKDFDGARAEVERAIQIDPQDVQAYDDLGVMYFTDQKYKLAADNFEKAIQVNPDFGQAYGHMGWVFYALKNYEDAIVSFEKAISMGQTNVGYYYQLGLSYAYLRQCDKARPWFEKTLEIDPNLGPAQDGLKNCQ